MPTLRKIAATPNTDNPTYQKNMGSGQVERGVHQRVGFDVLFAAHMSEVDLLVAVEEVAGASVERPQVRLLDLPAPGDLLDHELGVAPHARKACGRSRRRL